MQVIVSCAVVAALVQLGANAAPTDAFDSSSTRTLLQRGVDHAYVPGGGSACFASGSSAVGPCPSGAYSYPGECATGKWMHCMHGSCNYIHIAGDWSLQVLAALLAQIDEKNAT